MAKTIEQLTIQANEIKLATDRGENTAARVGGLFSDLVDYIAEFEQNDIVLGPLLTALNNSNLLDPEDGQTLTFSILDDNWTFSSAITQLKISQEGIEGTVASNYQATLLAQAQLNAYIEGVEETVRTNKRGYDADQVEYMTWHRQTDTSIGTFAAALTVDGNIISMSYVLQTCDGIEQAVTNNWNAYVAEKDRLENTIFGYTEGGTFHNGILQNLNAVTQESSGTASWINQNSSQISAVVANFDSNGNPTTASGIVTTSTYSGLFTAAMSANGVVTSGNISVYLTDFVDADGVRQIISVSEIAADKIDFTYTFDWTVKNSSDQIMFHLDNSGNMKVAGEIELGIANTNSGLKLTTDGDILRYSTANNDWVPLYAGRVIRIESRAGGSTPKSLYATDDFILFSSTNGWFETPTNVANGKVLTMRNMNGGTNTIRPAYGQRIRDFNGWHEHTDTGRSLNNDERAEMVYYNNVWYLNVIGS